MPKRNALEQILLGEIALIDSCSRYKSKDEITEEIVVTPSLIKKVLIKFLENEMSATDLQKWADFVCNNDFYIDADFKNNTREDFYENMWYVIQRISTPFIDGEINQERIRSYINELEENYRGEI